MTVFVIIIRFGHRPKYPPTMPFSKIILFFCLLALTLYICVECKNADSTNKEDSAAKEQRKVTKLQIGVKKRADKCERKGSKGDVLHIHYRVSDLYPLRNLF